MEQPSSQNENPNNAFHPYGAQCAPKVNADVGSEYMATARPMDPPQERCEPRRPRGHDFGQVQGMNSQNENPNKALQVTAHKAPNLNADVGSI